MPCASLVRVTAAVCFACALSFSSISPAHAQGGATATAEHLFNEGLAAMKRNDYVAACEAFAGSNEADPSPGTQINLALCNEKQGKIASAWGWYGTAASLANQRGQKERAELAKAEAAKLEPKLHKLVITVKFSVDGLSVARDGVKVPNAALGKEDPIDPGEHTIEVTAPKKTPFRTKIRIAAAPGIDRIDVPALEDAPEDKPPVAVAPLPGGDTGPSTGSSGGTQRGLGWITLGVGLAAGIVAGVYAVFTVSQDSKRETQISLRDQFIRDTKKPLDSDVDGLKAYNGTIEARNAAAEDFRKKAESNQTGAIAFGIASGLCIVGGLVLLFTAPTSSKTGQASKTRVMPLPVLGNGNVGGGFVVSF